MLGSIAAVIHILQIIKGVSVLSEFIHYNAASAARCLLNHPH
jgi:hypothetical protein